MARSSSSHILSLALTLLVLSPTSLAQSWFPQTEQERFGQPRRIQRGKQAQNDCNIQQLSASEPTIRLPAEAGVIEIWEPNQQEFQCAGVVMLREVIEPRGLALPNYVNTPRAYYVVQGNGLLGTAFPGCPETFESGSEPFSQEGIRGSERLQDRRQEEIKGSERLQDRRQEQIRGSEGLQDRHQKVRRIRKGDVIALPAGVTRWFYNNGQNPLVVVALFDTNSVHNQLDQILRGFFLAGNPEEGGREGRQHHMRGGQQAISFGNIFKGFDEQLLADAFNVDRDIIQRLQGQVGSRGAVIRVESDLQILTPEYEEEEQYERRHRGGGRYGMNGLEETFCSSRLGGNIDDPHKADIYNRDAGRLTFLNRNKIPILGYLDLSIDKGHLYQNAIMTPHFGMNSHRIHYYTKGSGRVQVTCERGQLVFDDVVREGQVLVIPQNFVVLKQAEQEGLEWVVFNTNGESMLGTLAGRFSAIRALPEDVVVNSFGVSREDARQLKFNREESHFFQPSSASMRIRQVVADDVKA